MQRRLFAFSFGIAFLLIGATGTEASVTVAETGMVIRILDKDYISTYIEWDFEPVNETQWYANFSIYQPFYDEAHQIFSRPSTHKSWVDFAYKWFDDPDDLEEPNPVVIAENMKQIWNLPRTADPEEMIFSDIDFDMARGTGTFYIDFPNGMTEDLTATLGFGSTEIATGNSGDDTYEYSWNRRILFDPFCKRWHIYGIDSGSDIHMWSSADGVSWTDGGDVDAATYDYEDFDVALDLDAGQAYTHIIYTPSSSYIVYYRRIQLDCDGDYVTLGAEQQVTNIGAPAIIAFADHVDNPSIGLHDDDCVMFAADFEDDSAVDADEHLVILFSETTAYGGTCGDGVWISAQTGVQFVQDEGGYNSDIPTGLIQFGDPYAIDTQSGDAQIYWIDTDVSAAPQIETNFWDESAGSMGTQRTLEEDAEGAQNEWSLAAAVWGYNSSCFGMDDGTNDVDSYRITSMGGDLNDQTDTGLNIKFGTGSVSGGLTAIVDINGTDADDIWLFGKHNNDEDDIWYVNSTNGGTTWSTEEMWINEASGSGVAPEYMAAWFWNCSVMLTWIDNADIWVDQFNTTGCQPAAPTDSCTYDAGDWHIDCSDWCQVTAVTDLDTNKLICTGSGEVYINAEVTYGSFVIGDGCRVVLGSDGKMVRKA